MYLKKVKINNFRNYSHLELELKNGINIFYGNNGHGKTNLLESIYVLGLTKSHRSFIDNNLIKKDSESSYLYGELVIDGYSNFLEIGLKNKQKKIKLNSDEVQKVNDYISNMSIIIFYPEDLEIIKSSPNVRRRFLNVELSQLYGNYYQILNEYKKVLKIRNERLKYLNTNNIINDTYIDILTETLIDKGLLIYKMRKKFIDELNVFAKDIFKDLSDIDNFNIVYKSNLIEEGNLNKEKIIKRFFKHRATELKLGTTLIGPHRDDFEMYMDNINLKNYGSQGQQRLAIISLKLAEIEVFKKYKGYYPILLLDDVFSELDDLKKNNLLRYLDKEMQIIITTTDLNNINKNILDKSKLFYIENGKVL